jgi:hypothetical protein
VRLVCNYPVPTSAIMSSFATTSESTEAFNERMRNHIQELKQSEAISSTSTNAAAHTYTTASVRGVPQNPSLSVEKFEDIISNFETRESDVFIGGFSVWVDTGWLTFFATVNRSYLCESWYDVDPADHSLFAKRERRSPCRRCHSSKLLSLSCIHHLLFQQPTALLCLGWRLPHQISCRRGRYVSELSVCVPVLCFLAARVEPVVIAGLQYVWLNSKCTCLNVFVCGHRRRRRGRSAR